MLTSSLLDRPLLALPDGLDASVPDPRLALLQETIARKTYLLVAQPWDPATSSRKTIYLSSDGFASGPGDTLPEGTSCAHQLFRARLVAGRTFNVQTQVMNGLEISTGLPSFGQIGVITADDDPQMLALLSYQWAEAPLAFYVGRPSWTLSQFVLIARGRSAGITADTMSISIGWRDLAQRLQQDVNAATYRGMDGAIYFDGTDDYVSTASNSAYDFTSGAFSVGFWIYLKSASNTPHVVSRGLYNTSGWYVDVETDRRVAFWTHSPALNTTYSTAIPLLTWTHVRVVRSGTTATFYINGVEATSSHGTHANPATHSSVMTFGRYSQAASNFLSGVLDEIVLHNIALTPDQAAANWDREVADYTNVVGAWHMNEKTGTSTADSSTTGATGTLTNGPLWVGSLSGGAGIVGRRIPYVFGRFLEWQAVCVDETFGVWQACAGAIEEFTTVLNKGVAGYTIEASSGDVAEPYLLYTNAPGSGKFRTCKAYGLIRFGGSLPDGNVTISGKGYNVGGYVEDCAGIVRKIAGLVGVADPSEMDLTSIAAVTAAHPEPVWIGAGLDAASADSLMVAVMASITGWRTVTRDGLLSVGYLAEGTAAVHVFTEDDVVVDRIGLVAESVPAKKTVLGCAPYGLTQGPSDLATSVTGDARVQFGKEYRYEETVTDTAVVAANASAPLRKRDTRITLRANAKTQATAEQLYWKTKRRALSIPLTQGVFQYSVGEFVELAFDVSTPLLNIEAGFIGQIVGYVEDVPANISLVVVG